MQPSLSGQVALVTGSGTGIGASIARALASEGARIALCGRRMEPLQAVAVGLPTESRCLTCDMRERGQVYETVAKSVGHFGRLDILVNNAGIFKIVPFENIATEHFDDVLATNLRGAFLFAQAAWPHLRAAKGQVLNLSSVAGTQGFTGCAAYCASKFGLNGLSEVLAIEGKEHGIRVFSVCPGAVDTPLWGALETDETLAKMMKPEDVADLCRWLVCSPRGIEVGRVVAVNYRSPWGE